LALSCTARFQRIAFPPLLYWPPPLPPSPFSSLPLVPVSPLPRHVVDVPFGARFSDLRVWACISVSPTPLAKDKPAGVLSLFTPSSPPCSEISVPSKTLTRRQPKNSLTAALPFQWPAPDYYFSFNASACLAKSPPKISDTPLIVPTPRFVHAPQRPSTFALKFPKNFLHVCKDFPNQPDGPDRFPLRLR